MPGGPKTLLAIFGAILFGLMTMSMLLMALVWSDQALVGFLMALIFGGLTFFSATIGVKGLRSAKQSTSALTQERSRVLRLAASKQGRLTAEETALGAHISVQQAQAILDELVVQGTADTWISDNGRMVYVFGGLLGDDDKSSAEDPMKFLDP